MSNATWASVTDVACSCNYLVDSAADPNSPIRYDPDINEYSIVFACGEASGSMCIYHCPFCGGRTPESGRGALFAKLPDQESERLAGLTADIKTIEDAWRILGTPELDEPMALPSGYTPPTDRHGRSTSPIRALTYGNFSDVADIQVCELPDKSVQVTFAPKYVGSLKPAV
jgi:hypothetical protein